MHSELDISDEFYLKKRPYHPSDKLLVGAGPSNCSPRVLYTMSQKPVLVPSMDIFKVMEEFREMLKYLFQTKNKATLVLQNSATGGMEAAITNTMDPGEKILVAVMGYWGKRICEIAKTRKLDVVEIIPQCGPVFTLDELESAIIKHKPALLFTTHGETSSGVVQTLEGLGEICHKYNCLLAIDAVITLGSTPLFVDRWGVDIAVSAPQKAARALPGLAYLTFSPAAVERIRTRKTVPPFYFNLLELFKVWNCFDVHSIYYYTYNSSVLHAAKEGVAEVIEEGLLEVWQKHEKLNKRLWDGLEKLGLKFYIKNPEYRLPAVTCVELPLSVTYNAFSKYLVEQYQMYTTFGIGPTAEKYFRVGIMGYNANARVVDYVVEKIGEAIKYCEKQKLTEIKSG